MFTARQSSYNCSFIKTTNKQTKTYNRKILSLGTGASLFYSAVLFWLYSNTEILNPHCILKLHGQSVKNVLSQITWSFTISENSSTQCLQYPISPRNSLSLYQFLDNFEYPTIFNVPSSMKGSFSDGTLVKYPLDNAEETEEMRVCSLGQEDPLEDGMATHSSFLAWRIPKMEIGELQSMGLQRVWHDWSDLACTHTGTHLKKLP